MNRQHLHQRRPGARARTTAPRVRAPKVIRGRTAPVAALVPHAAGDVPDLRLWDVIEVSSSAGKDSLAMLRYIVALARAQGVLNRVVVMHADLGRSEWKGTRELVEAQARHLGAPRVVIVKRPQGDLLDHVEKYGRWMAPRERYCTSDHKRGQLHRGFSELADELRRARRAAFYGAATASCLDECPDRPIRILNCIGLRAEESPGRRKRPQLMRDPRASSSRKLVDVWLPIQLWTEAEVWASCLASGAPLHPAYAAGLPRASCCFCFYMPHDALIIAGRHNPELLAQYVGVEQRIGHTFKHRLPIAKVAADIAAGVQPGPVKSWTM